MSRVFLFFALLVFCSTSQAAEPRKKVGAIFVVANDGFNFLTRTYAQSFESGYDSSAIVESFQDTPVSKSEEREFSQKVDEVVGGSDEVDVFIFSHSNHLDFYFDGLPKKTRDQLKDKLRLTYNSGCYGAEPSFLKHQGGLFRANRTRAWQKLGARAYVGHVGRSLSPVFLTYFRDLWLKGTPLKLAVEEANRKVAESISKEPSQRTLRDRALIQSESNLKTDKDKKEAIEATRAVITGNADMAITSIFKRKIGADKAIQLTPAPYDSSFFPGE